MQNVAPILKAIASVLWVIFAFVVLVVFKENFAQAIRRLKKAKFLGQEIELSDNLQMLANSANATAKEVEALPNEEGSVPKFEREEKLDAAINSILREAAVSPKVALLSLQFELERRARFAIATRGLMRDRSNVSIDQALSELGRYGLSSYMSDSLKLFANVRNKIIHGRAATDDDILAAIDSGITILKAMDALPNEVNIVYHPGVEVFSDALCVSRIPDTKGVILETTSPDKITRTFRIFPTTRTHFQRGKQVAWEWNMGRIWPGAWYRDPDSGEIRVAWVGSAEFVGRHLDAI